MVLSCNRALSWSSLSQINNAMIARRHTHLIYGSLKFSLDSVLTTSVLSYSWSSLSLSITLLRNVSTLRKCMMVLISNSRTSHTPIALLTSFRGKFLADLRRQSNLSLKISETIVSITNTLSLRRSHLSVRMTLSCCQNSCQKTWVVSALWFQFTKSLHSSRLWMSLP